MNNFKRTNQRVVINNISKQHCLEIASLFGFTDKLFTGVYPRALYNEETDNYDIVFDLPSYSRVVIYPRSVIFEYETMSDSYVLYSNEYSRLEVV